jgi:hypothetical protein
VPDVFMTGCTEQEVTVRIEHAMNLYRLHPVDDKAAAGRELILQVDAIVAEETRGWADRLRTSVPPAAPGVAPD